MDLFVEQLAALCREQVTRNKWVFVPSHALGHTLGERIARSGTNWLNLRFVTPLDIALRMGAPFLVERAVEPSEEGLGPALIMRLMLELPNENGYFRPLADQPTLAQALWTAVRELRMAGITSDQLPASAFASAEKHSELQALLASYEQFLQSNARGDMALVYEEALKHPEWCPLQAKDCWTELPDVVWTARQRRVMDAMPGERIAPIAPSIPRASVPRRLRGANAARVAPSPDLSPLAFLLAPEAHSGPRPADCERVELFHAGGREAEIEEVFRRILATGGPLDRVEIACASDAHVPLIWEKAMRHEWPVTLGPGLGAAMTRPGRALLALCRWIESDFSAAHLRRMLQSGDVRLGGVEGIKPGHAARLLVKSQAAWGRGTYRLSFTRLKKRYESEARNKDLSAAARAAAGRKTEQVIALAEWVDALVAAVPEEHHGEVRLGDVADVATAFLESGVATPSALDRVALKALKQSVAELRSLGDFRCSLDAAVRFVEERAQQPTIGIDRPRPGHVHVSALASSGYAGRPHLFVVGLEEGRVFPSAVEDPVLLDAERAGISPDLRLSTDRIDESVYAVLSRLASWGDGLSNVANDGSTVRGPRTAVFSYSSRDLREFRETYASWLMLQVFRLSRHDATKTYRDLHADLGTPVSCVPSRPETAATEAGWWLSNLQVAGAHGVAPLLQQFPSIAQGRTAAAERDRHELTEYDGYVPAAGAALDPCANTRGVSPTALEQAADCAFKYFLERGLRLEPLNDGERDGDVWLDALTRGAELHDLYADALRRCRDDGRRPSRDSDLPWLLDRARARLAQLRVEMPPPSDEVFDRESRDLLADLELFIEGECDLPAGHQAIGLEVSFGRPLEDDEPLAQEAPVVIALGPGLEFRLAGRIDRIDEIGPGSFEVIDYKTGVFWPDTWAYGTFRGGRRLQHALYGLAALQLLKRRTAKPVVVGGTYYFSTVRGTKARKVLKAPTSAELAGVIGALRDTIAAGAFVHTSDRGTCRYCQFDRACGGKAAVERTPSKVGDGKLEAKRRLETHE